MDLSHQISAAAGLVKQAKNIVAMTGAGISTASGIPDFRSANSGLWNSINPLSVASIHAFRQNPQKFYNWVHPLAGQILDATPNPAHKTLVKLEQTGKLKAIVTQNIDNLHIEAGSQTVYELHGHIREVICMQCGQARPSGAIFKTFLEDRQLPHCPDCGGVLKPNAVLFGEQLPMQEFVAAQMAIEDADLLLVAGSSLEVAPAADLPQTALANNTTIVIINYRPTYLDSQASLVIRGDVVELLPNIVDAALSG